MDPVRAWDTDKATTDALLASFLMQDPPHFVTQVCVRVHVCVCVYVCMYSCICRARAVPVPVPCVCVCL
jgi:hypothetical protein